MNASKCRAELHVCGGETGVLVSLCQISSRKPCLKIKYKHRFQILAADFGKKKKKEQEYGLSLEKEGNSEVKRRINKPCSIFIQ